MPSYICLLYDVDDAIVAATVVSAESLTVCQAEAHALLRGNTLACGFELWREGDKVYTCAPARNQNALG